MHYLFASFLSCYDESPPLPTQIELNRRHKSNYIAHSHWPTCFTNDCRPLSVLGITPHWLSPINDNDNNNFITQGAPEAMSQGEERSK